MFLPENIRNMVADENYAIDNIGMSDSFILIFDDKVLKVQEMFEMPEMLEMPEMFEMSEMGEEAENEYRMMKYLRGKIPVPEIYAREISGGKSYLLMSKCAGRMACSDEYMQNPAVQVKMLAAGLKSLWNVDISDCPSDMRLNHKLMRAKYNIENGIVDLDNVEPDTFGENGFKNPEALLQWLYDNIPEEEPVLSHGDYCLPNIFGIGEEVACYIDLGRTGIADKWCDIALCYRSLSHNYDGKYAQRKNNTYSDYDEMLLFRELGVKPDWDKIRYYILLDELF